MVQHALFWQSVVQVLTAPHITLLRPPLTPEKGCCPRRSEPADTCACMEATKVHKSMYAQLPYAAHPSAVQQTNSCTDACAYQVLCGSCPNQT